MNFTPDKFGVEDYRVHQLELKFMEVRSSEEASCSGKLNLNPYPCDHPFNSAETPFTISGFDAESPWKTMK